MEIFRRGWQQRSNTAIPTSEPDEHKSAVIRFTSGAKGAWNRELNRELRPNSRYVDDRTGYTYDTDGEGLVVSSSGTLAGEAGDRNDYQQRVAGEPYRLSSDDGGHLIATIFRGPGERINLVPMNYNLNRGVWKSMENTWAEALRRGSTVDVKVDIAYEAGSRRPTRFDITYQIDDENPETEMFKNSRGGR